MRGLKIRFAVYFCILTALSFFAYKNFQAKYTASLSAVLQYLPNEKKIEALQKLKTESIRTEGIKTELLEKLMYREDYSFFYLMLCAVFVLILSAFLLECFFYRRQNKKETDNIASYLDSLEKGEGKLIPKNGGILYDRLYKLYTELIFERENAQAEKLRFQKNLEDIAHQIKTPITAMLLSLENSSPSADNSPLHRLNELTERLLHSASLESGTVPMKKAPLSVYEACFEAYEACEHLFEQKGIAVHIESSGILISADYYWITEAFMNIFKNAASYLSKGNTVNVFFNETPLYTEVIFKDDGSGIQKEALRSVFNRFYKTPDSKGFGLGLNIAKSIAEKNNGTLCAYNENGAVFKFTFYKS
ncbi:HAMP domain-containing histidine kinase [Treponema sp. OMZ 788]|uniref:sensor histidine kinase n=1 Tax=Treponema sp. OMZ 788 TaxID=2563664 RepID=UPI0020A4AE14|nr:HAMP domain-containing sensor histidine kinase [Treponema sp. OMZ 788]UTC65451.1 HAMP domain-containing histidine kinase [Treponema sp. OMZ 788]